MSRFRLRLTVVAALTVAFAAATIDVSARTFLGDAGADRITGSARSDRILLGRGNDFARAGGGNDLVSGGAGRDRLFGGTGDDRVFGGRDNDRLLGDAGRDRLLGGVGDDFLAGSAGDDALVGSIGRDTLSGGAGVDRMTGGAESDALNGGTSADRVFGGSEDDAIEGRDALRDTVLNGGTGRDVCTVDTVDIPIVSACEVIQAGAPPPPPSGGGGTGGGGGGGGGSTFVGFTLNTAEGTDCPGAPPCDMKLTGRGAKGGAVTVEPGDGIVGQFESEVQPDGSWTVTGSYGCFEDSQVTLRSGNEQIIVSTTCSAPAPGGGGAGPLAVTSTSGTTCKAQATNCTLTITGTGADGGVVARIEPPAAPSVMGDQADAAGNWEIKSQWGCAQADSDVPMTIQDSAQEEVKVTLVCTP